VSDTCPCCGGTGRAAPEADPVAVLRDWCAENGHRVSPFDEVDTGTVAAILGIEPQSLRVRRCYYDSIPYRRSGRRALYRLADVAAYLDSMR
jgi:hypothetical protein